MERIMPTFLGIDIAKDTFDVTLIGHPNAPEQAQFANTPRGFQQLQRFLSKRQALDTHACMEATGLYYEALAHLLHEQGIRVSVVNPARTKAYADSQLQRNKTDRLDARLIADFCRTQQPDLWQPPSPQQRHLQALVRHLHDLEQDRQRQRNRLDALQHSVAPLPTIQAQLQQHLDFLSQQIEQVKAAIDDHIDQYPDLKQQSDLLISIPGIGNLTAAKLLAEFRNLPAFRHPKQLVAFAGLNPKHRQSGSSIRGYTAISKMGSATLRAALFMPALVAKRHNPLLRSFAQRLEQRGVAPKAIVIAVMRKLLHLVFGVLKSGQPFDPHFLENKVAYA